MLCLLPFAVFSGAVGHVFELPNLYYFIGLAILASALPFSLEMIALRNLTPLSFGSPDESGTRCGSLVWIYFSG